MAFSDEDLKRLKAPFDDCEWIMKPKKLKALLARLEAAEKVAGWAHTCPAQHLEAWRKAVGK